MVLVLMTAAGAVQSLFGKRSRRSAWLTASGSQIAVRSELDLCVYRLQCATQVGRTVRGFVMLLH